MQIPAVIGQMCRWIDGGGPARAIAVTGMHGVTEALGAPDVREALRSADLVVADGMPLVWLGRIYGHRMKRHVYGPELMWRFCRATMSRGYRHFLYGGAPGVAEGLAKRMEERFPGIIVAGTHAPPFRPLRGAERVEVVRMLRAARPDIIWVGLSTPRQELWMNEIRTELDSGVLVGVGAALDLNSGRTAQAPAWMRESGLDWFFRLTHEPRRLWKRYLLRGPQFLFNVWLELTGFRAFD
ncbi:MAG TPA: WecB/TagA/CpsF family glycosyltransferase [Candidatus Saccharimonadales bacterium]|nr:WecB/TagA/CpsF family glycosyltransferase [Candidatus Saccharimonadales bacterium]